MSGESTPSSLLFNVLRKEGLDFFVSVPCSNLDGILTRLNRDENIVHTPVTREEEGLGILAGAYLGGKKPAIVMQNSGLGNSINAICSLVDYYDLPMVILISHRGTEGEKIEAQKPMGDATQSCLEEIDVQTYNIETVDQIDKVSRGIQKSYEESSPSAYLFPISFWTSNSTS